MLTIMRLPLLVALFVASMLLPLVAQTVDPSGYWAGTVELPEMTLPIEIDVSKNASGALVATFAQPAQSLKGLPFRSVTVNGRVLHLELKAGPQVSTFEGKLSDDGQSITGEATQAGVTVPFTLTRKGEARVTPVPKSGAIGRELEGTWNGTIDPGGQPQRLVITMANRPDGSAAGNVVSPDGTNVEIPIGITHAGVNVTIEVPSVGASFVGVLNAAAGEIAGTWKQGAFALPVTLRRAQ